MKVIIKQRQLVSYSTLFPWIAFEKLIYISWSFPTLVQHSDAETYALGIYFIMILICVIV